MARFVQGDASAVIFMALCFILSTTFAQPPCSRFWLAASLWSCYAEDLDGRLVYAIGGKLLIAPEFRIGLHSQARLERTKRSLVLFYSPPAIAPGLIVHSPHRLNMVR